MMDTLVRVDNQGVTPNRLPANTPSGPKAFRKAEGDKAIDLAKSLFGQMKYSEALPQFRTAATVAEELMGPTHPATVKSQHNIGMCLYHLGRYTEAKPFLEKSLQTLRGIPQASAWIPSWEQDNQNNLAALQKQRAAAIQIQATKKGPSTIKGLTARVTYCEARAESLRYGRDVLGLEMVDSAGRSLDDKWIKRADADLRQARAKLKAAKDARQIKRHSPPRRAPSKSRKPTTPHKTDRTRRHSPPLKKQPAPSSPGLFGKVSSWFGGK